MWNHREKGVEREVTDLGDGGRPPRWFYALDVYLKSLEQDVEAQRSDSQMCSIMFPEFGCTINELGELWAVKIDLIGKIFAGNGVEGCRCGLRSPLDIR